MGESAKNFKIFTFCKLTQLEILAFYDYFENTNFIFVTTNNIGVVFYKKYLIRFNRKKLIKIILMDKIKCKRQTLSCALKKIIIAKLMLFLISE